jgi:hypothetical protein
LFYNLSTLKQINKTELFESAKCVLDDIETILFYNSAGLYYLPEDCGGELTYKFFGQDLIVEFEWEEVNTLDTNIVLGDYYNNEATIKIILKSSKLINCSTISNIGEVIAHEMTHWLQELNGLKFPNSDKIDDDLYYLQKHEIEAQYYGFEFQCNHSNLKLEEVVNLWFEKYGVYHNFNNSEFLKEKLLRKLRKFGEKEFQL